MIILPLQVADSALSETSIDVHITGEGGEQNTSSRDELLRGCGGIDDQTEVHRTMEGGGVTVKSKIKTIKYHYSVYCKLMCV